MIVEAAYKVPGGKMVRACVEVEGGVIKRVAFTGDFFMEPGEIIDELGEALTGVKACDEEVRKAVTEFFAGREVLLWGVSPEDFAKAVSLALQKLRQR